MAQQIIGRQPVQVNGELEILRQVKQLRRPLLLAALVIATAMAPILALFIRGVPLDTLTRDVFVFTGYDIYVGLLSNMGIVVWAAAAAVWLLCAAMLRRVAPTHSLLPLARGAGLYTLVLLADDALMLHEHLLPMLTGVSEGFFLLGYGLSALALLAAGASRILRTNYLLLLLAGGLFAASILCDKLLPPMAGLELLVEDGLKFAGIVVWAFYALDTMLLLTDRLFRRA
jgi:hypothetical protein